MSMAPHSMDLRHEVLRDWDAGMRAEAAPFRMTEMLFSVTPTDPVTVAGLAAVLIGDALFGRYLPARRATPVDPIVALRAG
jgi:hypothetical protein